MIRQILVGVLLMALGVAPTTAGQPPQPPERLPGRTVPGTSNTVPGDQELHRWARQLADEIEHLEEDLHFERDSVDNAVYIQVDRALGAVLHFERILQQRADREHLARDFQEMDRTIHALIMKLASTDRAWMHRAAVRIQYADQQLHYRLSPRGADQDAGRYRELIARHAHVLERESRQLARASNSQPVRGFQRSDVNDALESFADSAEHFHKSVESGADRAHLQADFSELDHQWHRIAERINQSAYGIYLRRRAARVNRVHNQLHELIATTDHHQVERPEHNRRQRPRIQFQIPGIGRFELRNP